MLRDADRDLAKGLRVGDISRKLGIAQNTYADGGDDTTPLKSTPMADAANWMWRWGVSKNWWLICSWTNGRSRTSRKKW